MGTGRNIALTSIAGSLWNSPEIQTPEQLITELLNHPERQGLPESEVIAIAKSISQRTKRQPISHQPNKQNINNPVVFFALVRNHNPEAYLALGATKSEDQQNEILIPLRDNTGQPIGWRRRKSDNSRYPNGAKALTIKGGKLGIISPWPIPTDPVVIVTEGETDAAAAITAGHNAVIALPGANPGIKVLDTLQSLCVGRHVALFPDNDQAGDLLQSNLLPRLQTAASVRVITPAPKAKDLDERLKNIPREEQFTYLKNLIESFPDVRENPSLKPFGSKPTNKLILNSVLPEIEAPKAQQDFRPKIRADESDITGTLARYQSALAQIPNTYQRDGRLCHIITKITSPTEPNQSIIANHTIQSIERTLDQYIITVTHNQRTESWKPSRTPRWLIDQLLDRQTLPATIKPITGINLAPTLRPDGSLIWEPGYDHKTSTLSIFDPKKFPGIDIEPTQGNARKAVQKLISLVQDFPFQSAHSASAWLAMVIAMACRQSIKGPIPAFVIDATIRGSGKTLLVDAASTIAYGKTTAKSIFPATEDEGRKTITAALLAATPLIAYDNIETGKSIGGAWLDALLTSTEWRDRILGKSEECSIPNNSVITFTGNNICIKGDLSRRIVLIRLQPNQERPDQVTGFAHDPLIPHILRNRPELLASALVIMRAWICEQKPIYDIKRMGSFEAFSNIRHALIHAGAHDVFPLNGMLLTEKDEEESAFIALMSLWHDVIDTYRTGVTTKHILDRSLSLGSDLPEIITILTDQRSMEQVTVRGLAKALAKHNGRIIGDHRFVGADEKNKGSITWRLKRIESELKESKQKLLKQFGF